MKFPNDQDIQGNKFGCEFYKMDIFCKCSASDFGKEEEVVSIHVDILPNIN